MDNYNKLTPAETERLAILAEECGEVLQSIGKVLRHGYSNYSPFTPTETNRDSLSMEIGDALVAISYMVEAGDISENDLERRIEEKRDKIKKWLHHQEKVWQ